MFHTWRLGQNALLVCLFAAVAPVSSYAQANNGPSATTTAPAQQTAGQPPAPQQPGMVALPVGKQQAAPGQPIEDKRAFGVIPNYKTAEENAAFVPLTTNEKFIIATKDSFDYPVFVTTAFFAGLSQWEGSNNTLYGQGLKGFANRYGIEYADQTIGNYFPEAIIPALFHDDPRYFRKSDGSARSRLFYALSRMFVCKDNEGHWTFNAPEIVGNISAAELAQSYHPHQRTQGDVFSEAGNFWESDVAGNIIKEFWPDVKRHFKRHDNDSPLASAATNR